MRNDKKTVTHDLLATKLRNAVETIVNDRRGIHWGDLDSATLRDLRRHVEREFVRVLIDEPKQARDVRGEEPAILAELRRQFAVLPEDDDGEDVGGFWGRRRAAELLAYLDSRPVAQPEPLGLRAGQRWRIPRGAPIDNDNLYVTLTGDFRETEVVAKDDDGNEFRIDPREFRSGGAALAGPVAQPKEEPALATFLCDWGPVLLGAMVELRRIHNGFTLERQNAWRALRETLDRLEQPTPPTNPNPPALVLPECSGCARKDIIGLALIKERDEALEEKRQAEAVAAEWEARSHEIRQTLGTELQASAQNVLDLMEALVASRERPALVLPGPFERPDAEGWWFVRRDDSVFPYRASLWHGELTLLGSGPPKVQPGDRWFGPVRVPSEGRGGK